MELYVLSLLRQCFSEWDLSKAMAAQDLTVLRHCFGEWYVLSLPLDDVDRNIPDKYDGCTLDHLIKYGWNQEARAQQFYESYIVLLCLYAWSWVHSNGAYDGWSWGDWEHGWSRIRDNIVPTCFYHWASLVCTGGSVSASDVALTLDDDTDDQSSAAPALLSL